VPRDSVQTVRFQYTLPKDVIRDNVYTLHLQQQAGAVAMPVTVRVELPEGGSGAGDVRAVRLAGGEGDGVSGDVVWGYDGEDLFQSS